MPHNVLISKIRCNNPNKKGAATHNKNHLLYIGTREGTDLTPLEIENTDKFEKEMASSKDYIRYIAKRPRSHGLFGNIPVEDINELSKKIYKLSKQKRIIYRGIVSLDPRDAEELGYYDKSKWETYIRSVIPDVAKKFNISVDKLQWAAAYHAEAKHPHVHYMFWSSAPGVSNSFIHPSVQNKCQEILSGKMFREEHQNEVINKKVAQNYIKEFGKELMSEELNKISSMTEGLIHKTPLPFKIPMDQLNKTTEGLMNLISIIPQNGSLKYKFAPPEVKEQIHKIIGYMLENKTVNEAYNQYLNSVNGMTMTYSPSKKAQKAARWKYNAIKDMNTTLRNIILSNTKTLVKTQIGYSDYAKTLLSMVAEQKELDNNQTLDLPPDDLTSGNEDFAFTDICKDERFHIVRSPNYNIALKAINETHDYEKAIKFLNVEASDGNVLAIHDLGHLCQHGLGCMKNSVLASDYYKKAFEGFNKLYSSSKVNSNVKEYVAYRIGKIYSTGNGVEKNIDLAASWFKKAPGNKRAQYNLAQIYMDKELDTEELVHYLGNAANQGNEYAQIQLGNIYLWGKGVKKDVELGKHYLNMAIENGSPYAQQVLDTYETFRLQYAMNVSYKLFTNIFNAISNQNNCARSITSERNFSKKAMIEEQIKNPHKHSKEPHN